MSPFILFLVSWAGAAKQSLIVLQFLVFTLSAWIIMIGAIRLRRTSPFLWFIPIIIIGPTSLPLFVFNLYIDWWQAVVAYGYVIVDICLCLGVAHAILKRDGAS